MNLPELEIDGCRDLARAVIKRATLDRHSTDEQEWRSAWMFVFADECAPVRQLWCDLAGIRVSQLQARWTRAEEYDRLIRRSRGKVA
jgi:hypothetical protein